ncbi:MAG: hypothetical protein WC860_01665 [Candidatus Margulisiibacteriota bacterium]|jgi:hypothetical protein
MSENEINAIIEKTATQHEDGLQEKIQYIMDFGEVSIQYDFCLN